MILRLKVSIYKCYSSTLFEVLIQIENIIFLNTINIFMEHRYNSNIIYQELLSFIKYSFFNHCSKLDEY